MKYKTFPILLAFLCMGFGDASGPLVGLAKDYFGLTNFMAQLLPSVGFIMFGVLSVPMGVLQDRAGKKFILLLGLVVALIGLSIPLFGLEKDQYLHLLAAILLLGAGASILQVAGNPIMRDVSPPEKYSRNLTIGQFIKAIGSLSASVIPVAAAYYHWGSENFRILFPIYSIAVLITVIAVFSIRVEEHKDANAKPATLLSCLSLLGNGYILMMVLGIFIYVGTEVSFSSHIPVYLNGKFGLDPKKLAVLGNSFFFIWIVAGRFLGSVVLNWISAQKFLILTVLTTIVGTLGLIFTGENQQHIAIACIVLVGIGCANIFPLVFSITVNNMPERTNEISGLMVTAIVGGAFIPPLTGYVTDATSVSMGFLVPLACGFYMLFISFISPKKQTAIS
jgi:fucose permease